uniref:Protein krueppel n=1 Tax=Anopheles merus TaxID=30066 RepID=A0A182UR81_ANOME
MLQEGTTPPPPLQVGMNLANGPAATAERQLCRLCLGRDGELVDIFAAQQQTPHSGESLAGRIQGCLQLDVTQHDTLPRWICKPCREKVDDFAAFRERCKQNERKLLLGEEDILHTKDGPAVGPTGEQTEEEEEEEDDDEDEEMEMIVIDPSRDYESSNDSLPHPAEPSGVVNGGGTDPSVAPVPHAEEEEPEGSDADEGDEEEEEEEEDELKCDTAPGETAPNGLPGTSFHTAASNTAPQKTVVFTCKYCDVAFAAASACQLHEMQDHDLLAPYACIFCQYKTSIRMFLITHIRDSHAVTRPYICIQCNKGFLRRSDLKKHTFVHTGVRPYACDQCGKSFSRNTNLKKHMRTHLGVKPHGCDLCPRSKQIVGKREYDRHQQTHSELKPFGCGTCGKRFSRRDKLHRHERIHQQTERHFSCPHCAARFVRKDAYESHLKVHCAPLYGAVQEMAMPTMQQQPQQQPPSQQHSLLYSMMGGDDGALLGVDPSLRM